MALFPLSVFAVIVFVKSIPEPAGVGFERPSQKAFTVTQKLINIDCLGYKIKSEIAEALKKELELPFVNAGLKASTVNSLGKNVFSAMFCTASFLMLTWSTFTKQPTPNVSCKLLIKSMFLIKAASCLSLALFLFVS